MLLSIIIPVYNEEATIAVLLDRVVARGVVPGMSREIVVVNDGSRDRSRELIATWMACHPLPEGDRILLVDKENGGKGSAVRAGIGRSTGDVVIIQDADLEYDPADYATCVAPIRDGLAKVVYGSREMDRLRRPYSYLAFYLGGLTLTYWMNLLYGCDLTDEPTCYKTFDGPLIRAVGFSGNKFDWEPEVTAKLLRLGYEIHEVPIHYQPRRKAEGKKIRWTDGVAGLWTALTWRIRPLRHERDAVRRLPDGAARIAARNRVRSGLVAVTVLAVLIRLLYALPGTAAPEQRLFRPDSSTYAGPAMALVADGRYDTSPGSGTPALIRPPGYAAWLALWLWLGGGSLAVCALASAMLGGLTVIPIFLSGKYLGGGRVGLWGGILFAVNLTAIALAPMFLSDSLFGFLVAIQLYFFLRFWRSHIAFYLLCFMAVAALGALVRPLNQFWILPGMVAILAMRSLPWKQRIAYAVMSGIIFFGILFPWMLRNRLHQAGWRLDAISGEVLYHNGAALLSRITGEPGEVIRQRLRAEVAEEFARHPERYPTPDSRIRYQEQRFFALVKEHPVRYFLLHFRIYTLLPDVPSFLENLGISTSGRGTWDILNRDGLLPAVRHYFSGNYRALVLTAPLLFAYAILYAFFAWRSLLYVRDRDWFMLLCLLLFIEFYLFVPGPVAMPRYHLPALPLICLVAGAGLAMLFPRRRHD
jgi:4-amino-4-deoxy-L-arabinose transferase-like glycosyltransferase